MPASPYALRLQRAEELSRDLPFAREILRFYIHLAEFQEQLHRSLNTQNAPPTLTRDLTGDELSQLAPHFDPFLALAETHGPAPLSQLSRDLRSDPTHADLLAHAWAAPAADDAPTLLAQIFLQSYAELLRARATPEQHRHAYALCPYCNRKPAIGVMRQQGDGAARSLICTFCHAEWNFLRLACPACGEIDEHKLAVYTAAESFPHIRVECCETCRTYIKTIDLTKNGHADPVVDELSSAPLDLWAQDHAYQKLHANLLGM